MAGMTQKPSDTWACVRSPQHLLPYLAMASCQCHRTGELGRGPSEATVCTLGQEAGTSCPLPSCQPPAATPRRWTRPKTAQRVRQQAWCPGRLGWGGGARRPGGGNPGVGSLLDLTPGRQVSTQGAEGTRLLGSGCLRWMPRTGSGPTRSHQGRFGTKPLCILRIFCVHVPTSE